MVETCKRFWRITRQSWLVDRTRSLLPNWVVNTFWHWPIAYLAAIWYGFPARKLTLIGVTGTDGKTTTVYLINHILKTARRKTAMISSVVAEIDGEVIDTGFHVTSPHPFDVQRYLKQAVEMGVEYAVLEVTSHALDQHRFAGCDFNFAIVTNIRPDHLDYHKTYEAYLGTKARLLKGAEISIINKDDISYTELSKLLTETKTRVITYSTNGKADITPEILQLEKQPAILPGGYNLSNILAASALAFSLGLMKRQTFHKVLGTFQGAPGRFEEIKTNQGFRVIIDFAHTPYALRGLLKTLRSQMKNKGMLIAVFGCAAERGMDRRKMGKVSAELADLTIITAEDPRFEGVEKISEDIAYWAKRGGAQYLRAQVPRQARDPDQSIGSSSPEASSGSRSKHREFKAQFKTDKQYFVRIPDRQEAINFAVSIAEENDVVALCGKGHEKSMNFKGIEYPWDERKAVLKTLQK